MNRLALVLAAPAVALVAACGGSSSSSGGAAQSSGGAGAGGSTTFSTGNTSLGTVLTNSAGFTLYYFTPEQGSKVACTGGCATTWPALKASGSLTAPSGVNGMLGMVALPDGSMEVTFNGWPLHTYSGDSAAGQTNGQGIGGQWFAATPGLSSSGSGAGGGGATNSTSTNPYGY